MRSVHWWNLGRWTDRNSLSGLPCLLALAQLPLFDKLKELSGKLLESVWVFWLAAGPAVKCRSCNGRFIHPSCAVWMEESARFILNFMCTATIRPDLGQYTFYLAPFLYCWYILLIINHPSTSQNYVYKCDLVQINTLISCFHYFVYPAVVK